MEIKDVFISYKAEEYYEANWVKSTLENNGISCWMAPSSIPGGSSYASEIPQAIRSCKVFVLILSEKSQKSKWVPRELDQAINENKIVMPFMLENCALKDDFNFYLTNVQRYAAYESKSKAIEKMINEIRAICGIKSEPAAVSDVAREPVNDIYQEPVYTKQKHNKFPPEKSNFFSKYMKQIILAAACIILIGIILTVIFITQSSDSVSHISIGGSEFSSDSSVVQISDANLSKSDIENFAKLSKIKNISLYNCVISYKDISALSRPTLETLVLSNCQLTAEQINSLDYSSLDKLSNLDIRGNNDVSDLSGLSELNDTLVSLNISGTSILSVRNLSEFQLLNELYADNNSITDITWLAAAPNLEVISLNGNMISDLTPLSNCVKLKKLYVNKNKLTDLSGLETCIELQEIEAGSNSITSIDALINATRLQFVFLNDNMIEDVSVLVKSSEHLQNLYLKNNKLKDIYALSLCTSLKYLNIDNNSVSSLRSLTPLITLEGLSAKNNEIFSFAGLENKSKLAFVNIAYNSGYISKDEVISFNSSQNVVVSLSGNSFWDINLPSNSRFEYLELHDCDITDYELLYSTSGGTLVLDYSDRIDFNALSAAGYSSYKIVDCPLDKQVSVREALGSDITEFISGSDCENLIEQYIPDVMKGSVKYYK